MTRWPPRWLIIEALAAVLLWEPECRCEPRPQCSPFRTLSTEPRNAKNKILAAFPLYESNCEQVRPDVVQALFAVQWALGIWNKNPQNVHHRIGLTVVGLCYDEEEFMTESFKLLDSAKYFEHKNCRPEDQEEMLYMLLPDISPNYGQYKSLLQSINIPMLTFSTLTTQLKVESSLASMFSTSPTLDDYAEFAIRLLRKISSNWITLIGCPKTVTPSAWRHFQERLHQGGIIPEKSIQVDLTISKATVPIVRSKIVLLLSDQAELSTFLNWNVPNLHGKMIISIPTTDRLLTANQRLQLFSRKGSFSLLLIEPSSRTLNDFQNYFVDLLKRNSRTYALLASYTHSQYNCTLVGAAGLADCGKYGDAYLHQAMVPSRMAEAAALGTYAIAAMARSLSESANLTQCGTDRIRSQCSTQVSQLLGRVKYTFGPDDPHTLRGASVSFDQRRTLNSIQIVGRFLSPDSTGRTNDRLALDYDKATQLLNLYSDLLLPNGDRVNSVCSENCRACSSTEKSDGSRTWMLKSGDIYLAGMFDLRSWDHRQAACVASSVNGNAALAATLVYTLETVKRKYAKLNLLPNVEIGAFLTDTCGSSADAVDSMLQLRRRCLLFEKDNTTVSFDNVMAYVTGQNEDGYNAIKSFFHENSGFYQPLLSSNCAAGHCAPKEISLLPSDRLQAKAIQSVLSRFNWNLVSVLVSEHCTACRDAFKQFQDAAAAQDTCIGEVQFIGNKQAGHLVPSHPVVLAFTTAEHLSDWLKTVNVSHLHPNTVFLLLGDSHGFTANSDRLNELTFLSIQPGMPSNPGLEVFLERATPKHLPQSWLVSFWEDRLGCSLSNGTVGAQCDQSDAQLLLPTSGELIRERYLMAAVESWVILTDEIYKKVCPNLHGLCDEFFLRYPATMESWIRLIKGMDRFTVTAITPYSSAVQKSVQVEGAMRPQGVTAREVPPLQIGRWSLQEGLTLPENRLTNPLLRKGALAESQCHPPACRCKDTQKSVRLQRGKERQAEMEILMPTRNSDNFPPSPRRNQWRLFGWNYLFLVLGSALIMLTLTIFGIIIFKMVRHVVKGNQSLGICLLFGVTLLYGTTFLFIFDPTDAICRLRHFSHSFSYSLCFGVLIAKATQLRNSETLGINGYISLWNYWLLLFFIVSVQIALNLQWTIFRSPMVLHFVTSSDDDSVLATCGWTDHEFLSAHSYVFLLLAIALFISFVNRNVKRNYKETRWLVYTCALLLPIWITWTVCYVITPYPYKDVLVMAELLCCATIILALMFGPKLYLLIFYEPVLIEYPNSASGDRHSPKELYDLDAYFDQHSIGAEAAAGVSFPSLNGSEPSSLSSKYQAVIWKKSKSRRVLAGANELDLTTSVMTGFNSSGGA